MLTKGDDFPIHQTPEPLAYSGSDRNFYDRYFFNGYKEDGSDFFALAFGIYPHLNIADAHFSAIRGNTQHCLHTSRLLNMERMDLSVGPIRIEVIEPLQSLRIIVDRTDGVTADLTFTGRAFPVEEPRFTRRAGPRTILDYTRMTQNGRWAGWIDIDGQRHDVSGAMGTRDRSWGIRPIGARDAQQLAPPTSPQFFWLWSPVNLPDGSLFFHDNADARGHSWNKRAVWCPDNANHDGMETIDDCNMTLTLRKGWRHAVAAELQISGPMPWQVHFEPVATFLMRGIGYGHQEWGHGVWKGMLVVEREDIDLSTITPGRIDHLHIQAVSQVRVTQGGQTRIGTDILEQLILGPYAPLELETLCDG